MVILTKNFLQCRDTQKIVYIFDQGRHFNKAVCINISKPLLPNCGEMACVEEYLHTFGNSDITIVHLNVAKRLIVNGKMTGMLPIIKQLIVPFLGHHCMMLVTGHGYRSFLSPQMTFLLK